MRVAARYAQLVAAGELRARDFSWDRINQSVADTYLRLIRHSQRSRKEPL